MHKGTKLCNINSTQSILQIIEQAICDSHLKEKLNEESRDVGKIKSDPNYFFRYGTKITSVTKIFVPYCIPTHSC